MISQKKEGEVMICFRSGWQIWISRQHREIQKSLSDAVAHGIYGYSEGKDDYFQAAAGWYEKHFGWKVEKEWLIKTPGVVFALAMAVKAYTKEGDAVLLQQPVYYPFSEVITDNHRRLINSPLQQIDGHYEINFEECKIISDVQSAQSGRTCVEGVGTS